MSKLIILNGPLSCGKTVLTQHLKGEYQLVEARCKDKLYKLTYEFFNIPATTFFDIYKDRDMKEVPLNVFSVPNKEAYKLGKYLSKEQLLISVQMNQQNGSPRTALSIREAMIFVSEMICKPLFGQDYFGKCRSDSLVEGYNYIDDSGGFPDEVPPAIMKVGMDNILLLRIYGRGTFEGDSRDYLPNNLIKNTRDVWNDSTEELFIERSESIIKAFMEDKL